MSQVGLAQRNPTNRSEHVGLRCANPTYVVTSGKRNQGPFFDRQDSTCSFALHINRKRAAIAPEIWVDMLFDSSAILLFIELPPAFPLGKIFLIPNNLYEEVLSCAHSSAKRV